MGYSQSPSTLEKLIPSLGELNQGKPQRWTGLMQPNLWAYKVREALYIAKLHADDYPELAQAAEKFSVVIVDSQTVETRLKQQSPTLVSVGGNSEFTEAGPSRRVEGPQTAATIIEYWIKAQPSNSPLYFPQAGLSRTDLIQLYQWAEKQGWFLFVADDAITLQRSSRDLAGLQWTPEDLE